MKLAIVQAVAVAVVIAATAEGHCGEVFDRVTKSGTVRMGVTYNRAPHGFFNSEGKWVGFEVDLAEEMARHMNLKLEMVKVNDKTWSSMLSRGLIDGAMCRIRHTRSLESQFDFSVPYFFDSLHVMVLKGRFTKASDLTGQKVTAVQGTLAEKRAMKLLRDAGDKMAEKNVISYPDRPSCFLALGREKVAGWIDSGIILLEYASRDPKKFQLIRLPGGVESVAVALPQNDSGWRDLVNFTIQDMAGDGSFKKIYEKWFGQETPHAFPFSGAIGIWPE